MATEQGEKLLKYLEDHGPVDSLHIASLWQEDHQKIVGVIKSLLCLGDVIEADLLSSTQWELTSEGKAVAAEGSHEALVFYAVPAVGSISQAEIMAKVPSAKVGFSKAMSLGWIAIDKSSGAPKVIRKVEEIQDKVKTDLKDPSALDNALKQEYKKRKLIQEITVKSYTVRPGPSFTTSVKKQETDLTAEMIATGSWRGREKDFKPYNLNALGTPIPRGHLHPLMKVRAEFRQIFLEMGFTEMPTNNFVESSFWNFDALFQPQQHPARDAHDTFFLSDPATATGIPEDYMERVKKVHSEGGYGSQGYGYDWKIEEAQKNVLRTHTTAVSARMLYKLAQEGFKPAKYFSIDRVFRNETLDATHLAEFHQVEGVVADRGLSLGHLMWVLHEFFKKLGMEKLRFKPAYNPYTEPSMEVFSYHPGLKKWIEIGNSGIFRPEMLLPMGLPKDVQVIAWGLSLERPTMIKYGYDNIRDLVGPRVNLQMVADNPLCRLDKHRGCATEKPADEVAELEEQMDSIMSQLQNLEAQVMKLKKSSSRPAGSVTVIIEADPSHPPRSLQSVVKSLVSSGKIRALVTVHQHSTLPVTMPTSELNWLDTAPTFRVTSRLDNQLNLTWIWKPVGSLPIARTANISQGDIRGQPAIARLLARYAESWTELPFYEDFGSATSAEIDEWIDQLELVGLNSPRPVAPTVLKRIEARLAAADWLAGPGRGAKSLADVFLSCLFQGKQLTTNGAKAWLTRCQA